MSNFVRIYEVRESNQRSFRVNLPRRRRDLDQHIFGAVSSNSFRFQRCDCRNGQSCFLCENRNTLNMEIPQVTVNLADAIERALSSEEPRPSNDISVIPEYKAEATLDDECAICFDKIKKRQKFRALPCSEVKQHCFHVKCIDQWLQRNKTCPVCRAKVI